MSSSLMDTKKFIINEALYISFLNSVRRATSRYLADSIFKQDGKIYFIAQGATEIRLGSQHGTEIL